MPPDSALRRLFKERLETFSAAVLLPLFFAFTGLRTEIGLLSDRLRLADLPRAHRGRDRRQARRAARWPRAGPACRWSDAFAVGVLMNTRGLVELIVLNIGLDLGILSPRIFAMLVVMALVTTMMTGPLLSAIDAWRRRPPVGAA